MSKYELGFYEPANNNDSKELWNNGSLVAFTAVLPMIIDRFKSENVGITCKWT